jgi:hypothetical protein
VLFVNGNILQIYFTLLNVYFQHLFRVFQVLRLINNYMKIFFCQCVEERLKGLIGNLVRFSKKVCFCTLKQMSSVCMPVTDHCSYFL